MVRASGWLAHAATHFMKTSAVLLLTSVIASAGWAADPLPSWNDTASKKAITAFVEKGTKEGSPDFVPPNERIATFDNDGTLWAEQLSISNFSLLSIGLRHSPRRTLNGKPILSLA